MQMAFMQMAAAVVYYDQRWRILALRLLAVALVFLVAITDPIWREHPFVFGVIQLTGAALVVGAVLGRLWSTLYIGGRKNTALITTGAYSITRNPLYFFSTIGSVGIGFGFGSLLLGAGTGVVVGTILYMTARGEAALLRSKFTSRYDLYAARVPLFWPNPAIYHDARESIFLPSSLKRATADSLLFMLVIPIGQLAGLLRQAGLLPSLISLP